MRTTGAAPTASPKTSGPPAAKAVPAGGGVVTDAIIFQSRKQHASLVYAGNMTTRVAEKRWRETHHHRLSPAQNTAGLFCSTSCSPLDPPHHVAQALLPVPLERRA